jgi:hypothetical protein
LVRPLVLLAVAMPACLPAPDPAPPAARPAAVAAPASLALPAGARIVPTEPGRYAGALEAAAEDSCSQSWAASSSRSAVVLALDEDGSAVGCRSLAYTRVGGGWDEQPRHVERREQAGMRGTWWRRGDWVEVRLDPAPDVCPTSGASTSDGPAPWHLRCVTVEGALVAGPALLCHLKTRRLYIDALGYAIQHVLPDWSELLVLGPDPGIRAVDRRDLAGDERRFELATHPIRAGEALSGR